MMAPPLAAYYYRQVFVVDYDEIQRVARGISIPGDNGSDGVAHKIDFLLGQHAILP